MKRHARMLAAMAGCVACGLAGSAGTAAGAEGTTAAGKPVARAAPANPSTPAIPHVIVSTQAAIRPVASFQEIMLAEVIPAATSLWNAVSTETTSTGTIEHSPVSDADWLAVRHQALVLIEAGNLLLVEGRPIVARGARIKDAEQPGILGPEQIRRAIAANRGRFVGLVHALQDAGREVLDAADRKDASALSDAGGDIDEACEACHKSYWYPPARQGGQ